MIYGILWIIGGLFLHFQDRLNLPIIIHSWIVLVILIILSGIIAYASNKSEKTATTTADASGDDDSSATVSVQATETDPQATSSSTNWGGMIVGLILSAILIGVFVWAPWSGNNFSPAVSKADREMLSQGWVELVTPGPDEDGFWSVVTPTEAIGKTSVVFKTEVIAERANGDVKEFVRPKKILVFSAGLRPGGLPDLKFARPPSQGRIRVKFQ